MYIRGSYGGAYFRCKFVKYILLYLSIFRYDFYCFIRCIEIYFCAIIIFNGGSMFVDFVGYPYLQIYVPTNVLQSDELSCIVIQQTSYPQSPYESAKSWQSTYISLHELDDSTVNPYIYYPIICRSNMNFFITVCHIPLNIRVFFAIKSYSLNCWTRLISWNIRKDMKTFFF